MIGARVQNICADDPPGEDPENVLNGVRGAEGQKTARYPGLPELEPEVGAGWEAEQPNSADKRGAELCAQDGRAGVGLFLGWDLGAR